MYQTSNVTPTDLGKIKVKRQSIIEELVGSALNPSKEWVNIKNQSKNFTVADPEAMKADELFAELMKVNGLSLTPSKKKDDKTRIRIRERERSRAIEIMKLKLQITA